MDRVYQNPLPFAQESTSSECTVSECTVSENLSLPGSQSVVASSGERGVQDATSTEKIHWRRFFEEEESQDYYQQLKENLHQERALYTVYPPRESVFAALKLTPFERLRVVIVGQDPYHGPGQAHGLCFSVKPPSPLPPSLQNIYKEIERDLSIKMGPSGDLSPWALQGVLLLNSYLTVRQGEPLSHKGIGWERFTDRLLAFCMRHKPNLIFALWGRSAKDKALSVAGKSSRHTFLTSTHPSPLSAHRGFLGCGHFSKINEELCSAGETPIDWQVT